MILKSIQTLAYSIIQESSLRSEQEQNKMNKQVQTMLWDAYRVRALLADSNSYLYLFYCIFKVQMFCTFCVFCKHDLANSIIIFCGLALTNDFEFETSQCETKNIYILFNFYV